MALPWSDLLLLGLGKEPDVEGEYRVDIDSILRSTSLYPPGPPRRAGWGAHPELRHQVLAFV